MEKGSNIKVGDLMTREFVHVSPDTSLKDCARMMIKKKVGSLIVQREGMLEGILTEKDIIWVVVKKDQKELGRIKAKDIMKKKVVTIKPGADVFEALKRVKEFKVRRLPVVEEGKVIGMITIKDILKIDPSLFEILQETVKIKEEAQKLKKGRAEKYEGDVKSGRCSECGAFGPLYKNNYNNYFCEDCLKE
jgi:CBS domain-containing protein